MRISESERNKNCLYYACRNNVCGSFLGWCILASRFPASAETVEVGPRQRNLGRELADIKEDMLIVQDENRKMIMKMEDMENMMGFIKTILVVVLVLIVFIFLLILVLIGGRMRSV